MGHCKNEILRLYTEYSLFFNFKNLKCLYVIFYDTCIKSKEGYYRCNNWMLMR